MAGSTSHRNLAPGSVLWGMGFTPTITVGINSNACFAAEYVQGTKNVVVGTNIDLDGPLSASDSTNDNAYMPGATALQFENEGDPVLTFDVTGLNQFGDKVTETVSLDDDPTAVYTNHCYTKVISVVPTAVSGWAATSDKFRIGFEHNDEADCPYPIPFRLKDTDHIQGIAIKGVMFDGSDITVSKVYNTITVKNSATNIQSMTALTTASIVLTPGAAGIY